MLRRITLLSLLVATPALAQVTPPKVFHACYVPLTGTVYRISEPGLRTACASSDHVAFSWTDGGAPPVASTPPAPSITVHGQLSGLAVDDHKQYLPVNPTTRALRNDLDAAGNTVQHLRPAAANGEAVPFEQALKFNDVVSNGDLTGRITNPTVRALQGTPVSTAKPTTGQTLRYDGTTWVPVPSGLEKHRFFEQTAFVSPLQTADILSYCPAGTVVTGGGYDLVDDNLIVHRSMPFSLAVVGQSWLVRVRNASSAGARKLKVYAVCAQGAGS